MDALKETVRRLGAANGRVSIGGAPDGFDALIERRAGHEPVAHIVGYQEFFGLPFAINADTLIPRGDSETIVEAALEAAKTDARALDMGTGSGALLLAFLHERPSATGIGIDASAQALARAVRCPVNVVDRPEMCDITTPALVDRDPVVIAIGSEGTAPVLTREIKVALETMLAPRIGALAALAGRLRPAVAQSIPHDQRRRFWSWVFRGAPRAAWDRGGERAASAAISAISASV